MSPRIIIAVANGKGGVGKTTTAVNLAAALAGLDICTLLVDLDPQSHSTMHVGQDPRALDSDGQTMAPVLMGRTDIGQIHINLWGDVTLMLAPAGPSLADAEIFLARDVGGPFALRDALATLFTHFPAYQAVVIDCPPHFGTLTANALIAATHLLIPVQTEALACDGIPAILHAFKASLRMNPALQLLGILPTMYHKHLAIHRDALAQLQDTYAGAVHVFPPIPRAAAYPQSAREGRPTALVRPAAAGLDVFNLIGLQVTGGSHED